MEKCVISIGSINADIQMKVEKWPEPGEALLGKDLLITGGGKGANVAFQAEKFGVMSTLAGKIGDDLLSSIVLKELKKTRINLENVRVEKGHNTGIATIYVRPDGEKAIILIPNANYIWTQTDIVHLDECISGASSDSVVTIDLEIPEHIVDYCIKKASKRGLTVVLDPSPATKMKDEWYKFVDFIVPNKSEVKTLTAVEVNSLKSGFDAGHILNVKGVKNALIKMGPQGCAVVNHAKQLHIPSIKVDPVDTTGAGDSFAGVLSAALVQRWTLEKSVRCAVVASALATTTYGSQQSYKASSEILRYVGD